MKFIYADSLDYVDPHYDFVGDRNGEGRRPYWDDLFPHELMREPPYDGVLVSRAIVGGARGGGKYTDAQKMRFQREGARSFLRMTGPKLGKMPIFGDCGAFSYAKETVPPYTPQDTAAFYADAGFTHGCSTDHIIFEFDENAKGMARTSEDNRRRFDITLENAAAFRKETLRIGARYIPLGVIQGWSPDSMANAAKRLERMGYSYLALGGTVPLKAPQIRAALTAIRDAISKKTRLHILGFAKADEIESFVKFGISSFDTTSPLLRAFKDAKANYYLPNKRGGLDYYTAIRVPQATENPKLMQLARRGVINQEKLLKMERNALAALRAFDKKRARIGSTLDAVLEYAAPTLLGEPLETLDHSKAVNELRARYERTLSDRPWTRCRCSVCQQLSIEVIIFRASNRNKRRGIHNLSVYKRLVDALSER